MNKKQVLIAAFIVVFLFSALVGLQFVNLVEAAAPPTITIHSPQNTTYTTHNISIYITAYDSSPGLTLLSYGLDEGPTTTLATAFFLSGIHTLTGNITLWVPDGSHSIVAYARNDLTEMQSTSNTVYFTVDTVLPSVSIMSPENKTYDTSDIPWAFTVNKPTLWIGYSLDGQANVTITENTTLTGLSDGIHSLVVYAKDIAGNTGASKTITFRVTEPFPITWVVAAIVITAIGGVALLVYFVKVKKTTEKAE